MERQIADVLPLDATASAQLAAFGRVSTFERGDIVSAARGVVLLDDLTLSVRWEGRPGFDIGFLGSGAILGVEALFVDYPAVIGRALRDGSAALIAHDDVLRAIKSKDGLLAALMRLAMASSADHFRRAAVAIEMRADKRVAQWIADCARTLGTNELDVTHHDIAQAMGLRRSSVTDALRLIERGGAISSRRRRLTILDAAGLARYAGVEGLKARPGRSRDIAAAEAMSRRA